MDLGEKCGVFGVYNAPDEASFLTYLGLYALQHRGQEGTGIVSSDGKILISKHGLGWVSEAFKEQDLAELDGCHAIGHNRYSTAGSWQRSVNVQPIVAFQRTGQIALAHNGNLTNAIELRKELTSQGAIFKTTSDTEVIIHLIAKDVGHSLIEAIPRALARVEGAYSLIILTPNSLIAVRDPLGVRPLLLGTRGDSWLVASETCAFDIMDAKLVKSIDPGEMIIINTNGVDSKQIMKMADFPDEYKQGERFCIFESIYFSRPDSIIGGESVDTIRRRFGTQLAKEHPVKADIVIPVPDSSISAALGYAAQSGLPYEIGLIRNHYVGRTFIDPNQDKRELLSKIKYNPVRGTLEGQRVVVVDDSIVRGNTSNKLMKRIYDAGAKEVHLRISSPPIRWSCFYGIDTPTRDQLLASKLSVEGIKKFIGVDTLGYLSIEGMLKAAKTSNSNIKGFCTACFDGNYPVGNPQEHAKLDYENLS
jgi:amidophosphoribosyltransferase